MTTTSTGVRDRTATGGGVGDRRVAAGRRAEGERRVRLRQRPVGRRDAVGGHAAQPAPLGADRVDRHRPGARRARRLRRAHRRRRTGGEALRPRGRRPAGARHRRRPLPGRAGGAGRRRAPRDRPPGGCAHRRRLRGARAGHRREGRSRARRHGAAPGGDAGGRTVPGGRAPAPARQPLPAPEDPQGRPRPRGRRGGRGRLRGRHAGPGVPRAGVRAGRAGRGRRHRPLRRHPVAARRPGADLPRTGDAARQGASHAGRRRWRVRWPRGPVDARARLPARAAHGQAGQDVVQPRGVVLRSCAPAPGDDALRARLHPRRRPGLRPRADLARRRRLPVQQRRGRRQRRADGDRALRRAERPDGLLRRVHQQPAVRRDARLRCGAGGVRLRVADGQGRRGARHGPGRPALPQRDGGGLRRAHRAGAGQPGTGRRAAAPAAGHADARVRSDRWPRPAPAARRRRELHPRRGRAARRRLRGGVQEHRVLGGLRRLLDGAGAARGRGR